MYIDQLNGGNMEVTKTGNKPWKNQEGSNVIWDSEKMVVFFEFEKKWLAFCQHPKKHLDLISL